MISQEHLNAFVQRKPLPKDIELKIAEAMTDPSSDILRLCLESLNAMRAVLNPQSQEDISAQAKQEYSMRMRAAAALARAGKTAEALAIRTAVHENARQTLGELDRDTLSYLNGVARLQYDLGDLDAAKRIFEHVIGLRSQLPPSTDAAISLTGLARVFEAEGDYVHAVSHHRAAVALFEAQVGPDDIDTGVSLNDLGVALFHSGENEQARACFERALLIYRHCGEDEDAIQENIQLIDEATN